MDDQVFGIKAVPGAGGADIAGLLAEADRALADFPFATASRERLIALSQRLAEKRLHVAVLGQFKRGKSTLLNALLGADLLPTAVVPLTAVPIFIAYGPAPLVRILFEGDRPPEEHRTARADELRSPLYAVAAEEANPKNRLGVARIEVFLPAPVLAGGTVLIDTPGIGSTHRHNTETALRFLPECDAGLVVLSADPPITEAELNYLAEVRAQVPRLFFLLNKVDYLEPKDRSEAVAFLQRVLAEHLGEARPPIYTLSARRALAAKQANDPMGLESSGLAAIETEVLGTLAAEKSGLLAQAIAAKAGAALVQAGAEMSLAGAALRMPAEELGRCLAAFESLLPRFERQQQDAQDLLAGDRKRLVAALEDAAEDLRGRAARRFGQVIADTIGNDGGDAEVAARTAVAAAIPVFFETELADLSRTFTARVAEMFRPHQGRAAELIGSVRQAAADLFDISAPAVQSAEGLELSRQPYWLTQNLVGSLMPLAGGALDFLLPHAKRMERLHRRLLDEAMALVLRNVENLRWSTLQNLDSAFRRFSGDLDRQLQQAIDATHGAIHAAFVRRSQEADKVAADLERIERAGAAIGELVAALQASGGPGGRP